MALASHIRVAQTEGPKAGFNAYVATLERAGLDTAKASLAEIRAQGGKKAQFAFYCAKFGNKFGATPIKVDDSEDLSEQIAELQAKLDELRSQGVGVVVEASATRTSRNPLRRTRKAEATKKENLWRPWAIDKFGITPTVGSTFKYTSKRAGGKVTTHKVVRVTADGVYAVRVA